MTNRGHGDDEEVDALPVGDKVAIIKVQRVAAVLQQVNQPGGGQPDGDDNGDQLSQSNGGGGLQHVQVLQNVRKGHQAQGAQESQA